MAGVRRGYMCMIDFDCELGAAPGGTRVFASEADLLRYHECAEECGIVEVEVREVRVVKDGCWLDEPHKHGSEQ